MQCQRRNCQREAVKAITYKTRVYGKDEDYTTYRCIRHSKQMIYLAGGSLVKVENLQPPDTQ